jgi:hypothetical protein
LVFSYHKGSLFKTNLLFVVNNGVEESHSPTGIAVKKSDVIAIRHELQKARQLAIDRVRRGPDPDTDPTSVNNRIRIGDRRVQIKPIKNKKLDFIQLKIRLV